MRPYESSNETRITVAVPTYGNQSPLWWSPLNNVLMDWGRKYPNLKQIHTTAAMPDVRANIVADALGRKLTHHARMETVERVFVRDNSEWVLFLDHDTLPGPDFLDKLLSHEYPFVAGVYHLRGEPHNPLIYRRQPDGLYQTVTDYELGSVFSGKGIATGLGCALIHRDVFDRIHEEYEMIFLPNGGQHLIHRDDKKKSSLPARFHTDSEMLIYDGDEVYFIQKARRATTADHQKFIFPYFEMNAQRTEDLGFCERAERVGFPVRIDTTLAAGHVQTVMITHEAHTASRNRMKRDGVLPAHIDREGH